jgi:hypothetical protein
LEAVGLGRTAGPSISGTWVHFRCSFDEMRFSKGGKAMRLLGRAWGAHVRMARWDRDRAAPDTANGLGGGLCGKEDHGGTFLVLLVFFHVSLFGRLCVLSPCLICRRCILLQYYGVFLGACLDCNFFKKFM